MRVLVLNCGSSSIKFAVIDTVKASATISGLVEEIGKKPVFKAKHNSEKVNKAVEAKTHEDAITIVQGFLDESGESKDIAAICHRVVHGGEEFSGSALITDEVIAAIEKCSALAPLHNPHNLAGIKAAKANFPKLPQVAVFDTAFHRTLPRHAYLYGLPYELYQNQKVRKYGFHGSSHAYVSQKTAEILGKSPEDLCLIIVHAGNGCSATAVKFGKSVDTTLGLTPLEGLVMGTRSGTIDPGIIFHLNRALGYDFKRLENLLNKESGLLGLSGISSDMREVLEAADKGNERAQIAVEVFCYRLAKEIASLSVALPRIDALVFTGGIGENSAPIREKTLQHLGNFKFSKEQVLVVPTNEELFIAKEATAYL